MRKRTWMILLAAGMVLALSACGGSEEKNTETQQTEDTAKEDKEEEEPAPEEELKKEEADVDDEPASEEAGEEAVPVPDDRLVTVDDVTDYVTIGKYTGFTLDKVVSPVTEEDITAQITYELDNSREPVEDQDASAENGDQVNINFVGTVDGTAFDGGTADDYELVLGEGMMIDGFEDGIVGMKVGETKDIDVTFPEYYSEESLAGQPAVFQITLNQISRAPELTDEWVAENTESATIDEYREAVRAGLEESASQSADYSVYDDAWNMVLDASEVKEYPEADVNNAEQASRQLYEDYAAQVGISLEEFVQMQGYTMEAFEEENHSYAQEKVKQNLIVQGIMDAEGLSLDDEQSLAIQEQMEKDYGTDLDELVQMYGQAAFNEAVGLLRVQQFITENSTVNESVSSNSSESEDLSMSGDVTAEEEAEDVPEDVPEEAAEE